MATPDRQLLVLPRPGTTSNSTAPPSSIPAPTESSFTDTFGHLLPPANYLSTPHARAAYYTIPPTTPSPTTTVPSRVLLIHGVQTPSLGLIPLTRALTKLFPSTTFTLLDLWGHGLTSTPMTPHTPSLFHSLITSLLTQLEWDKVNIIAYSFGASLTAGYVSQFPEKVDSFTLIAPAGLMKLSSFTETEQAFILGTNGDEGAARDWIISFLEDDGELVVPDDWEERVARGEVVAEKVREWEMRHHRGHEGSVVGIFRDGKVVGNHEAFRAAAKSAVKGLVVLGEDDGLCCAADLEGVGMGNVHVISGVGHAVVRERVTEVAGLIEEFWKTL